jgi:hypothetical protein
LLKEPEQRHAFHNDDRRKIDKAYGEAEALFRPKMKTVEPSLTEPSRADALARKPRVLSASAPPLVREIAKSPSRSEPQIAEPVSQCAHNDRERLNRVRAAMLQQQHELQAKLEAIDSEMRAIDAYEAAMNGTRGRSGRKR